MVTNHRFGRLDLPMSRPCKQCVGCRLDRSLEWAARCMHTARLHTDNCFITLTYDDDHLPENGVLVKKHFQDFMKRLRDRTGASGLQYYHAGEYGDLNNRPHYHACLFGYRPSDLVFLKEQDGVKLYSSPSLMLTWGMGFVTVGEVTFESAAYCARYIMKKVLGKKHDEHYKNRLNLLTGEIFDLPPEYSTMSRRPALGKAHIEQYMTETYLRDSIILSGREVRVPKYYDVLFERAHADQYQKIKAAREARGKQNKNNTEYHRTARRLAREAKMQGLTRAL